MRHTLVIGLIFLAAAQAIGAEKPIPQDTARMEKQRRDRLEWNLRTTRGAYDKIGKKNPRWDEPARKAMEFASRMFSLQVDPQIRVDDVYKPAKIAIDAGCDDPLLDYLYRRSLFGPHYPGEEESARQISVAAEALAASRYPAFRRAIGCQMAGSYTLNAKEPSDASRKEAERRYDAALALLPESVAGDEPNVFWEDRWFDTIVDIIQGYRKLGLSAPAALERVDSKLAKLPALKVLRLQIRGDFWYKYGWEGRTMALAPAVPAGGFEVFTERLDNAQKAFNEAWRLRPDDARTAEYLLDIEKGIGGDRSKMELWFDRAMKADGDRVGACATKLDWLDPKWHGTAKEMVEFGRACRATKNWQSGITLCVADAHYRYADMLDRVGKSKYLASPEVWSDVKSVYDEYLQHFPRNDVVRSKYAAICYLAAHYPEAHAQFQVLGDRLTQWPDFPYLPLESMKRLRDDAARIVAGK